MKLQISFDITDLNTALAIAKKVEPFCDNIEIGTMLLYKYGISAVTEFKKTVPNKSLIVDTKILDRGKTITNIFAQSGCKWVTVMAGTSNAVIHSVCAAANEAGLKVLLDLLDETSPGQSALEAEKLGVSALLFHSAHDEKEEFLFLDQWEMVRGNTSLPIFVSAKINRNNVDNIIKLKPEGIIVGTTIVTAENPEKEAQYFYDLVKK